MMVSIEKDNLPAKIVNIISHRTFFTDIEQLYSIMKVLSYAVTLIQSRGATLADCHLVLAYLYVITNDFSSQCDYVDFNRYVSKVAKIRLKEFQNPFYLTCFYLHPKYRGAGLLSESRSTVYRCIAEYSKLIGNNSSMTKNVIGALQRYKIKAGPYSLIYSKGKYTFCLSSQFSLLDQCVNRGYSISLVVYDTRPYSWILFTTNRITFPFNYSTFRYARTPVFHPQLAAFETKKSFKSIYIGSNSQNPYILQAQLGRYSS